MSTEVFLHENFLAENGLGRESEFKSIPGFAIRSGVQWWLIEMQLLIVTFILEVEATWLGKMSLVMLPEASKDVRQSEQE